MPDYGHGKGGAKRRDEPREPRDPKAERPGPSHRASGAPHHEEPEHMGSLDESEPREKRERGDIGDQFDLWI
jgi:hypothetical protein